MNLKTDLSEQAFKEACQVIPGGVNSPVRAFKSVGGKPLYFHKAEGAYIWDIDGNRYIDYVGSWGPAILGHTHPKVQKRLVEALANGFSFGAPTVAETKIAKILIDALPAMEKVRLVSSGTEACMTALRLARAYTKRTMILKFTGCYHGHADMLLVKAGSGVATLGLPDSPGVPQEATQHTLATPFNDTQALKRVFEEHGNDIAGVILEPIAGNTGFIRPESEFLQALRDITSQFGSLLIFDEVMTGFRVGWGGAQVLFNMSPDLTTLGKVIGGGLPLAAFGGKAEIMDLMAPEGPVYQAGTLSGNPLAVAAGLATLEELKGKPSYEVLHENCKYLLDGIKAIADSSGVPLQIDYQGGMFGMFFHDSRVCNHEHAKQTHTQRFISFFQGMLNEGCYFAPSAFEAGFISMAHTQKDLDDTIDCAKKVISTLK